LRTILAGAKRGAAMVRVLIYAGSLIVVLVLFLVSSRPLRSSRRERD